MKTLALCCLTLRLSLLLWVSAAAAPAQSPASPAPSDPVAVLKYSWVKERINWEGDPFGGPVENFEDMRRRQADQRRVERARAGGNTAEAAKVEREMRSEQVIKSRAPAAPRYAFHYKISVRNAGQKAIKELDWDYVFFDATTGQELGRREFTGVEKIAPGKSKELSFMTSSPPVRRISVQSLDKNEREGLREQVVLVRVLYEDGTVWRQR
ncbi:MAG: hypothetical protein H0T60_14315 [Acidobacteria bacterium]|nr:hypothetical protein [Acidobacteriota bacterium]